MLSQFFASVTPIYLLTHRIAERRHPAWLQLLDLRAPYLLMALMTVLLLEGLDTYRHDLFPYDTSGSINSRMLALYGLVAWRLTLAGVEVGQLIQRSMRELLITTPLTTASIVAGMFQTVLLTQRRWIYLFAYCWALGTLIRIVQWSHGASLTTTMIATAFLIPLILLCVLGAIGVGAALGLRSWRLGGAFATGSAVLIQLIPMLAIMMLYFVNFPSLTSISRFDHILNALIGDFTFLAFGDVGLTAINRLAIYGERLFNPIGWDIVPRWPGVFLPMMCTLLVQSLLVVGATTSLHLQLRPDEWRVRRHGSIKGWTLIDWIMPTALFLISGTIVIVLWLMIPRVPVSFAVPPFPYVNRELLRVIQYFMAFLLTVCALRAISAGVAAVPMSASGNTVTQWVHTIHLTVVRLRVWILGLSLVLMLLFVVLYVDHQLNGTALRILASFEGYWWQWGNWQRGHFYSLGDSRSDYYWFLQWHVLQVIGALAWSVIMSGSIIIGSVILGFACKRVWPRSTLAFAWAVVIRSLPVVIGLLPPNYFTLPHPGILATRLHGDPLFSIADAGLTVLIGLAEPGWGRLDWRGLVIASYGVVLGIITFGSLLGYAFVPFVIGRIREGRLRHTGPERSDGTRLKSPEAI